MRLEPTLAVLLLASCASPCGSSRLAPSPTARAAIYFEGGGDRVVALHDATGATLAGRWIDASTRWPRQTSPFASGTHLWWISPTGELGIAQSTSLALFELATGTAITDVPLSSAPQDILETPDGVLVATDDAIAVVDPAARMEVRRYDLAPLSTPLGRIALVGARVLVGTDTNTLVVAAQNGGNAATMQLPAGVSGCDEVIALPLETTISVPRAAVLCHGSGNDPNMRRPSAGIFVLEVPASGTPQVVASLRAFERDVPSDSLIALGPQSIALHAQGSAELNLPDAVLTINIATSTVSVLTHELYNFTWGRPLGSGAFFAAEGEIWWPSVSMGVLRWRFDGTNAIPIDAISRPSCVSVPARDVRALD